MVAAAGKVEDIRTHIAKGWEVQMQLIVMQTEMGDVEICLMSPVRMGSSSGKEAEHAHKIKPRVQVATMMVQMDARGNHSRGSLKDRCADPGKFEDA